MPAIPEAVAAELGRHDTSTLSDALDRLGRPGACPGIVPLAPHLRLAGAARTLRYAPIGPAGGTVGDYIDDIAPGEVVVLDNAGRLDCTVWGDILTSVAVQRRIAGTVVHGVCRDVHRSLDLDYPLFSRGRSMVTGKDRVRLVEADGEVSLGTVPVVPGDLVVGDADGIVVVHAGHAAQVLDVAGEIAASEDRIRSAVESGATLAEARRTNGYFTLQTPTTGPTHGA